MLQWVGLFTLLKECNPLKDLPFFHVISCAGVGHGVGAYCRGVGRDLSVGARSCQFTATDRTEPGGTLGKVKSNTHFLQMHAFIRFIVDEDKTFPAEKYKICKVSV